MHSVSHLSAVCLLTVSQLPDWPTVGHLSANCWPFVCHLVVDHGPTFIHQMADKFWPKNRTAFAQLLAICRLTVSYVRYLIDTGVIKILRTRVWIGAPGQKWLAIDHWLVDHRPAFIHQMSDKFWLKDRTAFARLLAIFWPTVSDVKYLMNAGVIKILRTRVWIGAPGQKLYLEKKKND